MDSALIAGQNWRNLDMIKLNPNAQRIWEDRYRKNGETLEENFHRVAKFVANTKEEEDQFFYIMSEGYFMPGGRTTSNAGVGTRLSLNNCFVAPKIEDDLGDIFNKVRLGALTHKSGGKHICHPLQ